MHRTGASAPRGKFIIIGFWALWRWNTKWFCPNRFSCAWPAAVVAEPWRLCPTSSGSSPILPSGNPARCPPLPWWSPWLFAPRSRRWPTRGTPSTTPAGHFHPHSSGPATTARVTDSHFTSLRSHLNLQHAFGLSCARARIGKREVPLWAPPAVPVVVRLELMVLDAQGKRNLISRRVVAAEDGAHTVTIMVGSVLDCFHIESWAPGFGDGVRLVVLEIRRFLP